MSMLHQMKLKQESFEKVKNGSKKVEIRLNDEKRRLLNVGDKIEFSLVTHPVEKIQAQVTGLTMIACFEDLFVAYPPEQYGGARQGEFEKMYEYYSPDDEKKYGVLAIVLLLSK